MRKAKRTMRKTAKSMRKAAKRTMRKAAKRTMRKAAKPKSKKKGKKKKGKRKLSPAQKAWNNRVMMVYRSMKKSNPDAKFGDAMKAAGKNKNRPLSMSVDGGGPSCTRT
jgi:hypothetical protein